MTDFRFLHKDSSHGYTDQLTAAFPHEPEAVTEFEQQAFSVQARAQFAESRAEENRRRDNQQWMERLRKAEMAAQSKGVDIFRSQATIRKEILNIEQQINGGTLAAA